MCGGRDPRVGREGGGPRGAVVEQSQLQSTCVCSSTYRKRDESRDSVWKEAEESFERTRLRHRPFSLLQRWHTELQRSWSLLSLYMYYTVSLIHPA